MVAAAEQLIASGFWLPRRTREDIVLRVEYPQPGTVHIKKGTLILIDHIGIRKLNKFYYWLCGSCATADHNPNNFKDPEVYRPERWMGMGEHDMPTFGFGLRSCIGVYQSLLDCHLAHRLGRPKVCADRNDLLPCLLDMRLAYRAVVRD